MSTASSSTCTCPSAPRTCSCSVLIALLVVVAGHEGAALADEEVEVRALVGLQYVIAVGLPVAARERRSWLLPFLFSFLKFTGRNDQIQFPLRHIQFDHVAVLHQCEQ